MSVRVVARIRPLLDKELDKDTIVRAESSQEGKPFNIVRIPNPKNESEEFSFTFNGVYDMGTTQEELFTNEVSPTLKSLFAGLDVTIFAYGVTGTGKTHTMRGGLKLSERGVIPRLLSGVYRRGRKVVKDSGGDTEVYVTLSYYEIYNDKVFDLFESPDKRTPAGLPLREKDGKTMVVGLSERACDDLKDFERLYIEANNNRSTAGTKLNAQSSRSHAILMVKLTQVCGDETRVSTASAIDLAGSEDNRRTENGKERLVESASINKSLFVLSQCIDAIGRGDKRIPYRESKMTRILSLGQNNGITIMILNLAPLRSYHLDTLSSLNVSSRAKRIEVREIENEVVFKQAPRTLSSISGATITRQPLRPLANAHNTVHAAATKSGDKPMKAFSVYSDKSTAGPRSSNSTSLARQNSTKRPSDSSISSRPTKMVRPNLSARAPEISAAKIEEMVERKVAEILASKSLNQPASAPTNDISEAVQRRLEALEKKVENGPQEDARTEGLRFLLMAKQHKERGEDSSALKMYELAVPFFPGQEKLQRKIDNLKTKIRLKREETSEKERVKQNTILQLPASNPSPIERPETAVLLSKPKKSKSHTKAESDDELANSQPKRSQSDAGQDDDYYVPTATDDRSFDQDEDDDSFVENLNKTKARKPRTKVSATATSLPSSFFLVTKSDDPPTPRSKQLLSIINSRDESKIKSLKGVGAKKARDLVDFLDLMNEEERIDSLGQLIRVPGLGGKTVEKMYEGITA